MHDLKVLLDLRVSQHHILRLSLLLPCCYLLYFSSYRLSLLFLISTDFTHIVFIAYVLRDIEHSSVLALFQLELILWHIRYRLIGQITILDHLTRFQTRQGQIRTEIQEFFKILWKIKFWGFGVQDYFIDSTGIVNILVQVFSKQVKWEFWVDAERWDLGRPWNLFDVGEIFLKKTFFTRFLNFINVFFVFFDFEVVEVSVGFENCVESDTGDFVVVD